MAQPNHPPLAFGHGLPQAPRRAVNASKAPIYTDLGPAIAQTASNTAIATGISGGAPLGKEQKTKD